MERQYFPVYPLTSAFFGLNFNYKKPFLEEIYICMSHLKISYSDLMLMPTYERRFYIQLYKEELDKETERLENAKSNSNVKGSRTVSGEALKAKMRNNEIQ